MKSQLSVAVAAAYLAVEASAQGANCAASCFSNLYGNQRTNANPWTSICTDASKISTLNSCVASTSCSAADKEGTYQAIAQLCANQGATITAAPQATFSATSGGSAYPTNQNWASYVSQNGWQGGAGVAGAGGNNWGAPWSAYESITANPSWTTNSWASWVSNAPWTTNPSWTTNVGAFSTAPPWGAGFAGYGGPFGGNWGGLQSSGAWTNGPWTSWWGNTACPGSTWSGWTSGPWGTNAPWTSWAGCTASTTATSVITTTSSGSVITTTSYGIRVAAVAAATATAVVTSVVPVAVVTNTATVVVSSTSHAAAPTGNVVAGGALVAALFGAVVAL